MTTYYNHLKIEKKWQAKWDKAGINQVKENNGKKKYVLDMFPYPSGDGLHVGHPEGYTATDIISRYFRLQGFNVLHPMGWDAFGLPAENFAIKKGIHPKVKTEENIKTFKRQIKALGFSYDWSREINTSSPDYYKWTQWLFLKLYAKGLAYKKQAPVNWCDSCKTVLANEQVVNSKCERCDQEVIQKDLDQWFFKTTEYAEELLNEIDKLDWPEALKITQKNWLGKSEGARLKFKVKDDDNVIEVFTTRPDTLYGATYMVLAPEHELIYKLKDKINNFEEVEKYITRTRTKSNLERTDLNKEKSGVELKGLKAINPINQKEISVYIADYVLTGYGTGAIMAVPAHDERDYKFAKKYELEIIEVIKADQKKQEELFTGYGVLINSDKYNGLSSKEAFKKITKDVKGNLETQFKIRDWLVSRQRYWGAPIPIIYCDKCGLVPVPEKDLPVLLPDDVDFKPTGQSPLVNSKTFHKVKCPKCNTLAKREVDTMDTFVCSAWYFLRYCDANNKKEAFDKKMIKYWMPVDLYVGGMEHAVGHLIYARFITKVLRDLGYLKFDEPFLKIRNQGLILAEDSRKMSKRWGNVINPDEVIDQFGSDTMRMYEMFMGPLEDAKPWSQQGIMGLRRFLEKVNKYCLNFKEGKEDKEVTIILHKTIKKVTKDIENLRLNTAIAAMMEFVNIITKLNVSRDTLNKFLILLAPFAPHLCEEINEVMGNKESIFKSQWPKYDKKLIIDDQVIIAIQINGKLRDTIEVKRDIKENDLKKLISESAQVKKYIADKEFKKFIYIPNKLVNLVI